MARRKRRFAFKALLILAALLAATWLGLAAVLSSGAVKSRMEAEASKYLGQKVTIRGPLTPGVEAWRPSISAHSVLIGGDTASAIEIGRLEVGVPLTAAARAGKVFAVGIGGLRAGGKTYGDYDAVLHLVGGGVDLPEVKGRLGKAKLRGKASYVRDILRVNLRLQNLDYSEFAEGVQGGRVKGDISLKSRGGDYAGLIRGLEGRVTLVGGEGRMEGGAIDLWAGSLLTTILKGPEKETRLNCVVADFALANGVARSRTVIVDTARVTISGRGTVDLVRERMDMRFSPRPKSAALLSLATPVRVAGPFGSITTHPDPAGVVEKMGGLLLGAVAAPAALLPFIAAGSDDNPCARYFRKEGAT